MMSNNAPKREYNEPKTPICYWPHGVNSDFLYRIDESTESNDSKLLQTMRKKLFGDEQVDFVILFNNRNIQRKNVGDVILAYEAFYKKLDSSKAKKTRLLMHTQPIDENGTNLRVLVEDLTPNLPVIFSEDRLDPKSMNLLYNLSDVVINLASNEGFGIGTLEGMMAERMIVANVTGGLQDQMGFKDETGKYLHEDVHFNEKWGSNSDQKYKNHGEWVVPVWPNNFSLRGSVPTPYISDERCDWKDAGAALFEIYNLSKEERIRRGKLGRQYALTEPFNTTEMCNRFTKGMNFLFENWKPRERFGIYKSE